MLDKMILGFLNIQSMTGYEIKKYIEQSTGHFFRMSFGSIYPVLHQLSNDKLVEMREEQTGGKHKKVYFITPTGREVFLQWLKTSPEKNTVEEELLTRLYFFDNLSLADIHHLIYAYLEKIAQFKWKLVDIEENILKRERQESVEGKHYSRATIQFATDYLDFTRDWFYRYLKELEEGFRAKSKE